MTTAESSEPLPGTESNVPSEHGQVSDSMYKVGRRYAGTTIAAVTLAAAAVLGGPGLVGPAMADGPESKLDPASIIGSPPNSASSRMAGVHEDIARAVALQQVTPQQGAFLEQQLVKRIQNDV